MSHGLEIRNANNAIAFSVTGRILRWYASYTVSVSWNSTVTVSVPGMTNDGTWFVSMVDTLPLTIHSGYFQISPNNNYFIYLAPKTFNVFRI